MSVSSFASTVSRSVSDIVKNDYSLVQAEPCRYRFLEVERLLSEDLIHVIETDSLSGVHYATTSFVWRGLEGGSEPGPSISVKGIEDEQRLSVDVLKTLCYAAEQESCSYLWLDKLSVRQDTSAHGVEDTVWQVQHMYEIYQTCQVCLVAAGGLVRLASLEEPTMWMSRVWTLQEALAPPKVKCIFSWTEGNAVLQHNAPILIETVVPGKAATAELLSLLNGATKSSVKYLLPDGSVSDWSARPNMTIRMFSDGSTDKYAIQALLGAIEHTDNLDGRLNAIWRCVIMRSAKFSQDLVFSIMGILGATVQPLAEADNKAPYNDTQLRRLVVIFMQRLAGMGLSAAWLGVIPQLGVIPGMSAMPILPIRNAVGGASVPAGGGRTLEVKEILSRGTDLWWWLSDAPKARVLDNGDIVFRARHAAVSKNEGVFYDGGVFTQHDRPDLLVQCDNQQEWTIAPGSTSDAYAIVIGNKQRYLNGSMALMQENNTTLLMLVDAGGRHRARNVGYAWADWNISAEWKDGEFTVGG